MTVIKEGINSVIEELEKEIKSLEEIQASIETKMNSLDGTNEIWKGDAQKLLYEEYIPKIKAKFPERIQKIKDYKNFLQDTYNKYKERDISIGNDIEKNETDLSINS